MNITLNGININYKISGNGERYAVVLQGWGTEMSVYDSISSAIIGNALNAPVKFQW